MEATGYAAVMADLCAEQVYLAEYQDKDQDPPVKWINGISQFPTKPIPSEFLSGTSAWGVIFSVFVIGTNR